MSDSNKPPSLRRRPLPITPSAVGCEWQQPQQPQVGTAGAPTPPPKHPHRYRLSEEGGAGGGAGSSVSDAGLTTEKSQDPMLPPGAPLPRHILRGRAPAAETSEAADSISHPAEPVPARMSDFGPLTSDRTIVTLQPRQDERTDKPSGQSVSPSRWRRGSTSSRKASTAKEKRKGVLLSEWREEILRAEHERETAQQQDREREREREQQERQAKEARAREEQDKKKEEQGNRIGRKELAERLERERDERYRDVEERREQRARETGQPRDYLAWGDDVDDLMEYVRGWRSSAEVAVAAVAAYEHRGRDASQPGVRRSAGSGSGARAAATRTPRPEQGTSISGSFSDTAPVRSLGAGGGRG